MYCVSISWTRPDSSTAEVHYSKPFRILLTFHLRWESEKSSLTLNTESCHFKFNVFSFLAVNWSLVLMTNQSNIFACKKSKISQKIVMNSDQWRYLRPRICSCRSSRTVRVCLWYSYFYFSSASIRSPTLYLSLSGRLENAWWGQMSIPSLAFITLLIKLHKTSTIVVTRLADDR